MRKDWKMLSVIMLLIMLMGGCQSLNLNQADAKEEATLSKKLEQLHAKENPNWSDSGFMSAVHPRQYGAHHQMPEIKSKRKV